MRYKQCRCNRLVPVNEPQCLCGNIVGTSARSAAPYIAPFPSGYWEHIAEEPIYIKSKKQLRDETRARGQVSMYAEGS